MKSLIGEYIIPKPTILDKLVLEWHNSSSTNNGVGLVLEIWHVVDTKDMHWVAVYLDRVIGVHPVNRKPFVRTDRLEYLAVLDNDVVSILATQVGQCAIY
jgi:hypothetical protein